MAGGAWDDGFVAMAVADRRGAGRGGGIVVLLRHRHALPSCARTRRHGPGRRQADGHGGSIPGRAADGADDFRGVAGGIAVWADHDLDGVGKADAAAHGAESRVRRSGAAARVAVGAHGVQPLPDAVRRVSGRDGAGGAVLRAAIAALVLGHVPVKLLANPAFVRMVVLFVFIAAMFIVGVLVMRRMRKGMVVDLSTPTPRADNAPAFTMAAFHSVLQQLKEKEQELRRLRREAQERASLSENVSAAVLTNLDTGV